MPPKGPASRAKKGPKDTDAWKEIPEKIPVVSKSEHQTALLDTPSIAEVLGDRYGVPVRWDPVKDIGPYRNFYELIYRANKEEGASGEREYLTLPEFLGFLMAPSNDWNEYEISRTMANEIQTFENQGSGQRQWMHDLRMHARHFDFKCKGMPDPPQLDSAGVWHLRETLCRVGCLNTIERILAWILQEI